MIRSVGFIGSGRVVRILLDGWRRGECKVEEVRLADPDSAAVDAARRVWPSARAVAARDAAEAQLVVLAAHPPAMAGVLNSLVGAVHPHAIVLSLAPKVPSRVLSQALGTERIVRMIPNAPSAIGKGFNPVWFSSALTPDDRATLENLFRAWGEFPEVAEADLEAYAVISGMGPTYLWFQYRVLYELAQEFGLPAELAARAVRSTVTGAVDLLFDRDMDQVMDLVPVRPLAQDEAPWAETLRQRLRGMLAKLRG
jgi:pyrroline-5-carboxylate reductase